MDEEEKYPREKEEGPHNTSSLGLVATLQLFWDQDILVVVVVVDVGVIYGFPSTSMHEGRLFVCFDLFVPMKSTQGGMLQIAFLVSLESSQQGVVHQLSIHGVWTCDAKVVEY